MSTAKGLEHTCTLNTPQMGSFVAPFAFLNASSMASKSPVMSLTFGDFFASFWAEGDWALRVRARISKSAFAFSSASITALPCLPVAPVMRTALVDIVKV